MLDLAIKAKAAIFITIICAALTFTATDASARRYADIIVDADTGEVLHQSSADVRNYPASLTKIMTLYIAFEELEKGRLKLNQRLKVSRRAQRQPPSKLNLRRGQTITVENAILALVTKSANDVAVVLAEAIAGTEADFAKRMTAKARELGMTRTTFKNASGLYAKGQRTTARDMAQLGRQIYNRFPDKYRYFGTRVFSYKGSRYSNHNKLLGHYEGTDGIKTGYIGASGFNLVASVKRHGRHLIGVVFGGRTGKSRDRQMKKLLTKSFHKIQIAAIRPPERPSALPTTIAGVQPTENPFTKVTTAAVDVSTPDDQALPQDNDIEVFETPVAWGIQVGAFRHKIRAQQAARLAAAQIRPITSDAQIMISAVSSKKGRLYQARLVGFTEPQARNACDAVETTELACVPVPPESLDKLAFNKN
ncbi:D-alanyl-D-alanine carboxypeptidase family protein [Aestuariispira ectoiniformans]|uniref:D-alanyl-D-alanine carboxypeptidase family protein n=1 Tax=Aestuariispira ectoiniformans TaxID=2775080 RepID=UPI00223A928D|nr:D-alanyl-D-alanine carboxypeptidase family protein [Aestuariispira ectoiniformans]